MHRWIGLSVARGSERKSPERGGGSQTRYQKRRETWERGHPCRQLRESNSDYPFESAPRRNIPLRYQVPFVHLARLRRTCRQGCWRSQLSRIVRSSEVIPPAPGAIIAPTQQGAWLCMDFVPSSVLF